MIDRHHLRDLFPRSNTVRVRPDGTTEIRGSLQDSAKRLCCRFCGLFVWGAQRSWRLHYNHCSELLRIREREKQRRRNPVNIDLTITKDPKRSACAVFVCDVAERAQHAIIARLHEGGMIGDVDMLELLVKSSYVRIQYLKAVKCNSGNRMTLATACVYMAAKLLSIPLTQAAMQHASGISTTAIRGRIRAMEYMLGLDVLRPRFTMPKYY